MTAGMGGLSGRWVTTRTEADAKMWRRYLKWVTPEQRQWSARGHRLWLAAIGVLLLAGMVLGSASAAG